jgi:hypothetical protein
MNKPQIRFSYAALALLTVIVAACDTEPDYTVEDSVASAGAAGDDVTDEQVSETADAGTVATGGQTAVVTNDAGTTPATGVQVEVVTDDDAGTQVYCEAALTSMKLAAIDNGCDEDASLITAVRNGGEQAQVIPGTDFVNLNGLPGNGYDLTDTNPSCGPTVGAVILTGHTYLEFSSTVDLYRVDMDQVIGATQEEQLDYMLAKLDCAIVPGGCESEILSYGGRDTVFFDKTCRLSGYVWISHLY